jgi:hypothetical protein
VGEELILNEIQLLWKLTKPVQHIVYLLFHNNLKQNSIMSDKDQIQSIYNKLVEMGEFLGTSSGKEYIVMKVNHAAAIPNFK